MSGLLFLGTRGGSRGGCRSSGLGGGFFCRLGLGGFARLLLGRVWGVLGDAIGRVRGSSLLFFSSLLPSTCLQIYTFFNSQFPF